jgi:RNA recognition motif-containing protein
MKLFVAKLNREVRDEDLVELFSQYGEVAYARVVTDRDTGQSKCFGFVQMRDSEGGQKAMEGLHDKEFMRFNMVVKEAEERPRGDGPRPSNDRPGASRSTERRPSTPSPGLQSERTGNPNEFSRHGSSDAFPSRDSSSTKNKSDKKPNRDIYQDGPRQPKLKRDRPKNADWLDDLDDDLDPLQGNDQDVDQSADQDDNQDAD